MALEEVVKQLAETFQHEGNTHAIYGEPVKLETKTIIPVACVQLGGGGGGLQRPANTEGAKLAALGGGGGAGFTVFPVGFLHEEKGEVVFTPIHVDVKNRPFLTEASHSIGVAIDTFTNTFAAYAKKALGGTKHEAKA